MDLITFVSNCSQCLFHFIWLVEQTTLQGTNFHVVFAFVGISFFHLVVFAHKWSFSSLWEEYIRRLCSFEFMRESNIGFSSNTLLLVRNISTVNIKSLVLNWNQILNKRQVLRTELERIQFPDIILDQSVRGHSLWAIFTFFSRKSTRITLARTRSRRWLGQNRRSLWT